MEYRWNTKKKNQKNKLVREYGEKSFSREKLLGKLRLMNRQKGSITVFLTGILLVMLGLVVMLVSVTKRAAVKAESVAVVNMSTDSVLAEYNRALLDNYDLFFIDASYGFEKPSLSLVEDHLQSYLDKNTQIEGDVILWNYRDYLGLSLKNAQILSVSLATDDVGRDVKYQAIEYIRDLVGLEFIDDIQKQYNEASSSGLFTANIEEQAMGKKQEIDDAEKPLIQLENGEYTYASADNFATDFLNSILHEAKKKYIQVMASVSDKSVNLDEYVSRRSLARGSGAFYGEEGFSFIDEILFDEYLLSKCGNYREVIEGSELDFEIEYLLAGKNSDAENIFDTLSELIAIRWATDFAYIQTDSEKTQKAEDVAAAIPVLGSNQYFKLAIKETILFAWSAMEAVVDVNRLVNDKKIPLIKSRSDWVTKLESIMDMNSAMSEGRNKNSDGLDYKGFLRLLLLLRDSDTRNKRFMDLVEMRLRNTEGNKHFRMDGCVDAFTSEVTISGSDGSIVTITSVCDYMSR